MIEITFKDFATVARKRGHGAESLAALFRGQIEESREFFERVMSCRSRGEDRSGNIIPYGSVIAFYHQEAHFFADSNERYRACACGCGRPVFDRKKWALTACRKKAQRQTVTDSRFATTQVAEIVDVKVGQKQRVAGNPSTEAQR